MQMTAAMVELLVATKLQDSCVAFFRSVRIGTPRSALDWCELVPRRSTDMRNRFVTIVAAALLAAATAGSAFAQRGGVGAGGGADGGVGGGGPTHSMRGGQGASSPPGMRNETTPPSNGVTPR